MKPTALFAFERERKAKEAKKDGFRKTNSKSKEKYNNNVERSQWRTR
jgi:hypothetical protein